MESINQGVNGFKSFLCELEAELRGLVARRIEEQLAGEVDEWLHRGRYERRWQVRGQQTSCECQRCGTRVVGTFHGMGIGNGKS